MGEPGVGRVTDMNPTMTTSDCARHLGVSTSFIVGEIRDGRLRALVLQRGRRRALYRISPAAWRAYLREYGSPPR